MIGDRDDEQGSSVSKSDGGWSQVKTPRKAPPGFGLGVRGLPASGTIQSDVPLSLVLLGLGLAIVRVRVWVSI